MQTHLQPVEGDASADRVESSRSQSLLAIWHLLSLDAPTVATVWTWFAAKVERVALPPTILAAMFLAVWILYAADRLLDGSGSAPVDLEPRHRFHRRHRFVFRLALAGASIALLPLVLAIPDQMLRLYLGLAILLAGWFVVVHLFTRTRSLALPKELMPGLFCGAAAFIPVWSSAGFNHADLWAGAASYALLIMLNCVCIYAWEHVDSAEAHWTTRLGTKYLNALGAAIILLATLANPPIGIATGLAVILLLTLNQIGASLDPTDLRAASDLVLLTPLLVAPFLR